MKFSIPAPALADAAAYVSKSISARPANPILSGVLIEATEGTLRLSGFDFERSARATVAADVETPGHVLLSARMFTDITKRLGNKHLTVTVTAGKAAITAGTAKYTLHAMPFHDYPELPGLPETAGTADGALFAAAVAEVAGAAATDQTLPILACVEVTGADGSLTFRATDRYRLAETTIPWEGADFAAITPAAWLGDVAKNAAGETQILTNGPVIGARAGNRATTTNTIGGDYPKIRSLFPDTTPTTVQVDRDDLLGIVGRVALVAERNTPVRLTITDGQITVDAGTGEDAQGQETLDATLNGDPITVAYNPHYLEWTLRTLPGDTAHIGFTAAAKPSLFTTTDSAAKHLIMPVRLAS